MMFGRVGLTPLGWAKSGRRSFPLLCLLGGASCYYWHRDENTKETLCLQENRFDAKVLIVGAGIQGASAAFHFGKALCRDGKVDKKSGRINVMLLDRETVSSGASGLSAGTIYDVGPGTKDSSIYVPIRHGTTNLVKELQANNYDCEYIQCGSLTLAQNEAEVEFLRKDYESAKKGKENVTFLDTPEKVFAMEPSLKGGKTIAALYLPESGHLHPGMTTHAFVEAALDANVDVVVKEGAWVDRIERLKNDPQGFNYLVHTKNGMEIRCEKLVLATGAWTPRLGKLLGLSIPIVPVKGMIWITEPVPTDYMNHVMFSLESLIAFTNFDQVAPPGLPKNSTHTYDNKQFIRHFYGKKQKDGRVLFGGSRIPSDSDEDHVKLYGVNDKDVQSNRDHVFEFLPRLKEFEIDGSWGGPMPFTMDHTPLVGELASFGYPNMYILSGCGPHGMMDSPMIGKLLVDAIVNENHASDLAKRMLKEFNPNRPKGIRKDNQDK